MVLWGRKGPAAPSFDTLSNTNMPDHKLQPGGKISRDPSPRPAMTAHSERERDSTREENWRRDGETEKMRDKARHREMDTRERFYERDRAPAARPREGEREWWERERRQQDDRSRNGRLLSNPEETGQDVKKGMKKGDTFPRIRKGGRDHDRRVISTTDMGDPRGERRERERLNRVETNERERAWQKEKYRARESNETRCRPKEGGKNTGGRPVDDERLRQRERYRESDVVFQEKKREVVNSRGISERDTARRREKVRPTVSDREASVPSPHRRREREIYTDRKEGRRDIRSEGDSDERELRRERVKEREREELIYQHSRSEGDTTGKTRKERDQESLERREEDRQKYRDRDRAWRKGEEKDRQKYRELDRKAARPADREGERWKERDLKDDRAWSSERREDDRYREDKPRRDRERKADHRRDNTIGTSSRSPNTSASRVPPPAQSSGEWSSDMDSETRYRKDRDSYEERESRRDGPSKQKEHQEKLRDPEKAAGRSHKPRIRSERQDRDRVPMTGSEAEQRRMWLDPQRGKNSQEEFVDRERHTRQKESRREEERSMESQAEWGRAKEELDERVSDQSSYKGRHRGTIEYREDTERETEGVSVDEEVGQTWRERDKEGKEHLSDSDGGIEGSWQRDAEGENVTDNTEESDREEAGGNDYCARSESEGGSEGGWKQDRDRMLSGEDSFVTVSSGGDEDYERESDEDKFKDCKECWEGGMVAYEDRSPVGFQWSEGDEEREEEWTMETEEMVDEGEQGREKQQKFVFCVIGQTLPRSKSGNLSQSQFDHTGEVERYDPNLETPHQCSVDTTQQSDDDVPLTLSRNDKHSITYHQGTEREERLAIGETTTADIRYRTSLELQNTESGEEMRSKVDHQFAEMGTIKRDSQTERLLKEWREKIKELEEIPGDPNADDCSKLKIEQIQPFLEQLNSGTMSPEEVEAIRIRMSGAWSMSEEPKRHSQAPHLKWAKNVVREILGHSDEQIVDETNTKAQEDQGINQPENNNQPEEVAQGTKEVPVVKLIAEEQHSEPELEVEELLEVEGLRGMGQNQAVMHGDQVTAMHVTPTYTHADTLLDTEGKEDDRLDIKTEPPVQIQLEEADREGEVKMEEDASNEIKLTETAASRDKEVKIFLSVSNTLYKPNSCPILNYDSESDLLSPTRAGVSQEVEGRLDESEEEQQKEELEEMGATEETGKMTAGETVEVDSVEGKVTTERKSGTLTSSCSFRDLGPEARLRRRGIRKTTERRNGELVEKEEEEGVGRDRRTRIFSTADDEDDRSKSWGEVELRNVLETINRQKRNSRFFNAAQLYQQYSEAAQNFEILSQARSEAIPAREDSTVSPVPSPPPARRPLPPLPPVPHPHSLSHTVSITSVQSLPLPEPPTGGGRRASSPRLSLSQSATLWRDLPGVRCSTELEELTEDQRRLQEVRFEVVTSEASYCRSLDIVVEHFVKSKQLGALLTTQDRNWLFSRLADVRAISHSFLSKLEERVESDMMYFTVCDIITRHCQRFKMVYVPYLTNQSYQDATYQRLMNENPGFKRIVEKLERSPLCQRLPLRSFLVLPFQRITRIKLLVQNIVKRTTPGTAEATQAIKALKLLEKLIQESNDSITQMKSIESLVSLSAKVDFECRTLPLISQSRRLVREGPVTQLMDFSLKDTERNVYLHLFNDYLLLSLQKEGGRFTVIDHSPVSELRAENCRVKLHSLQKNLFRLHMLNKSLLLRTDAQSDKLRWISAVSSRHPEIDFSAAQDFVQMQCIRAFIAQQPDELSLEKADIILVHQQSSDQWVEGTRLSDRHYGWVPQSHLEIISNSRVRQRNLSDALKLTTATATV